MTTIAYRGGVLAADTLTSGVRGAVLCTRSIKIGGRRGVLWATTGDAAWGKRFRDWMAAGASGEHPLPPEGSGANVFMPAGAHIVFHENGIEHRPGLPFWADGSGCDYALGAMQYGATAEEAVRCAMAWDRLTGGEVITLRAC